MADVYINCDNSGLSILDLLRAVAVDGSGNAYLDCDNQADINILDLLRGAIVEDASGNPAIAIYLPGGGGGGTIEQGVGAGTSGVPFPIVFGTAFADTSYSLHVNIYDGAGASVGFTLDSKLATGFTITPSANGTVNWSAIG